MNAYAGIVPNLPEAEYHAHHALSSTEARLLLDSPAKYRWKKDNPPLTKSTTTFDVGTAIHTKVLGVGLPVIEYPAEHLTQSGNVSEKAATVEWAAQQRAAGLTPITKAEFDSLDGIAEAVLAHPTAGLLFQRPGIQEASVFATIDGVECRGRFDFLPDAGAGRRIAVDLKSTADASPAAFTKSIAKYGYPIQRAWYVQALETITGESDAELIFVAVEKEPPYLVGVHQLDPIWRERGMQLADRARQLHARYTTADHWPAWVGDDGSVHLLSAPTWHLYETEGLLDD